VQRALLLSLIAVSYTLFAGGPRWTLIPLAIIAVAAILVAPRRVFAFPRRDRALDRWLIVLVAAMMTQIVPLPAPLVTVLSPHAADARAMLQLPALQHASWLRLSINPARSEDALLVVALSILTFWIARGSFSFDGGTRTFCRALALIGAVAAVSAIVFRAAFPGLVQGVLRPEARSANPFGAFVNRNHLAAWLLLVTGPVCGYLLAHLRIHPDYRHSFRIGLKRFLASGSMVIAAGAVVVVGVLLLTLSRSGVVGLTAAALYGWRVGRRRLRSERTNLPSLLAAAGIALLTVVLFVDISGWATRVEESLDGSGDRNRTTIWRESLPIVRDFWLPGTGAGTFGDAMIKYQQTRVWIGSMSRWAHFNNAHSHYLQVAVEGGLLILVPAAGALLALARLGQRAIRDDRGEMQWARIGAGGALLGIAVQSVWETSLVMPANAILCAAVAGLLVYRRPRTADGGPRADEHPAPLGTVR